MRSCAAPHEAAPSPRWRKLVGPVSSVCAAAVLLTGCTITGESGGQNEAKRQVSTSFQEYAPDATAITYYPDQVPAGARVRVTSEQTDERTRVTLEVEGLQPNRAYGAHVHTKPCGSSGADAGPHFQQRPDPVKPSVDPAYANPENEVWLDMTTDSSGNAYVTTTVDWEFREGEANSLVLHDEHTATHEGHAGTAGDRLACVTVEF